MTSRSSLGGAQLAQVGLMHIARLLLVLALAVMSAGCELIVDIFQAGMVIGIILVVMVIMVGVWIVRKLRGPRGPRV